MTGSTIMMTCSFEDLRAMIREVVLECSQITFHTPEDRLLTRNEVCDILHIKTTSLNKYTKLGVLQGRRIGRRVLYLERDVRAALNDMPNLKKYRKTQMDDDDDE